MAGKFRSFQQVDVFTRLPYRGNPVAVVLEGNQISTEQMQEFTNWTNLSEATFVLPPTDPAADYKLRIFCPGRELPFAGHPTLGTCHAWLSAGGHPKGAIIVQECGAGLVQISQQDGRLSFAAPPLAQSGPLGEDDICLIASGLGLARSDILHHSWCDNGPPWRGVYLATAAQVLAIKPDPALLKGLFIGVVGPYTHADGGSSAENIAFEVRAFFPGNTGLTEDPVTGSLNAALGQWLTAAGLAPHRYVASQGTALGRAGRVHVHRDESGQVWVGGDTVTCVSGTVLL